MMELKNAVVFITGAKRSLSVAFGREADDLARQVKQGLSASPAVYLQV